jgi:RHS repeat-associated protein
MRALAVIALLLSAAGPLRAQTPAVVVEYYHLDALGSVRAVTNESGQVLRRHDYHPFGHGDGVPTGTDPLRFTGKERDADTGLDYFGARYYASRTGRFTTVDPLMNTEAALTDPQRWNRYAYSLNNPLRYIDPDGRDVLAIGHGVNYKRNAQLRSHAWAAMNHLIEVNPANALPAVVLDSLLSLFLPVDSKEAAANANAQIFGMMAPLEVVPAHALLRLKPVNLPAWRSVTINMEEVISGHTATGARAMQSGLRISFPIL